MTGKAGMLVGLLAGVLALGGSALAPAFGQSALSEEPIPMVTREEVLKKRGETPSDNHAPTPHEKVDRSAHAHGNGLSKEALPLLSDEEQPKETPPIFQLGEKFLATGNLSPGIELPTGAIWQPSLWVFGDARTSIGHYDSGVGQGRQYWSNQLNLFFNLKLTPTERLFMSISPLSENGRHTGYVRRDGSGLQEVNGANLWIRQLFFEGEFGEIFPNLDPDDNKGLDFGFSIGRQQLLFQEGMMINARIDSIGITRDTIVIPGLTPDMRITALFGANNIHRDDNVLDRDTLLFGLFTETDLRSSTVNLDAAYAMSGSPDGGDGLYLGASAIQRIGHWNTAFRINGSWAPEDRGAKVDNGVLLFSEISRTLPYSENLFYANAFWGIGNYSSAARDPTTGGPLGRVGVLFASPAPSAASSALSNRADEAFGGALGYQMFFNEDKTQLTLEVGGRKDTDGSNRGAVAIGGQFLHALNNRSSIEVDAFLSEGQNQNVGSGLRMELRTRF
ncbi:hypothetical protein [Breoghania sp.]|uniref:hypothetical protein n=1 Tax=Breoghania sp. TaxID=2065378 RepID=UPI002AA8D747|nr:hypothetical protein [Breoghania sp.]